MISSEVRSEIYYQINYVAEKLEDKRYYNSKYQEIIHEIYAARNKIIAAIDSGDENSAKYEFQSVLKRYQNMYNSDYASYYLCRDVFNISSYELNSALSNMSNKFSNIKNDLRKYISEKRDNSHFSYPVRLAKDAIERCDDKLDEMKNLCCRLSSMGNNKKYLDGIEFTNLDTNEKYFRFLEEVVNTIREYNCLKDNILSSLPH